jgi:dihydroneopterin aldolase
MCISKHFKKMGLIQLENMEFYAYHGHFKEEQIVGNKFMVSLSIETDLKKAAKTDNLQDTLNYHKAYQVVKEEMSRKSYLLENIASRILDSLYRNFSGIITATVKISKINPPVGGKMDCVSITLSR